MKRRVWLLIPTTLLAVAAPALTRAQDAPVGDAVLLQFKHKPGQARRMRFDMKADFTVMNEGVGGGLGALPIGLKSTAFFTEKVASVEGPVASLLVTPQTMTLDTAVLGMSTLLKMEGGKLTMNGQPVPPGGAMGMENLLSGKPMTLERGPLGPLSAPPADGMGLGMMMNPSFLLQLSEQPVRVGESWKTEVNTTPSLPIGGPVAAPLPEMVLKLEHTLKSLDTTGGKRHALIETKGGLSSGESKDVNLSQTYSGTTRFDIPLGVVRSGRYGAEIKMKMPVPGGLPGTPAPVEPKREGEAPPAAPPPSIQVDGMMTFSVAEAPAPVKKPAPKKPAPRRPVRRR